MDMITKKNTDGAVRVLVVDDHCLILEVLQHALGAEKNLDVDIAISCDDAVEKIESAGRFDVILLDYQLPGVLGLDALRNLTEKNGGNVALFSGAAGWAVIKNALDQGACGFIPKSTSLKTLSHAIQFIAGGEIYLPYDYIQQMTIDFGEEKILKQREKYILAFLCEGLQNKEIAREVGVSEVIVKMDVKSICKKLGVRNRTQAVIEAKKRGIF